MTIETTLVKRRALYKGEIGFFASSPMAEQDIALAKLDEEIMCTFSSPRTLQQLKFLWALVSKVADNTDQFVDKDHAMEQLKLAIGHSRALFDRKTRKLEIRPKSLKRLSFEKLRDITNKMIDVICRDIIPGMEENLLRDEIEQMIKPALQT